MPNIDRSIYRKMKAKGHTDQQILEYVPESYRDQFLKNTRSPQGKNIFQCYKGPFNEWDEFVRRATRINFLIFSVVAIILLIYKLWTSVQ